MGRKKKASTNGTPPVRGMTTHLEEASLKARLDEASEMSPGDIFKKIEANQKRGRAIKDARELNEQLEKNLLTSKIKLITAQTGTTNLESQLKNQEAELNALREIEERFNAKLESSFAEQSEDAASEALGDEKINKALRKSNELNAEQAQLQARVGELTAIRDKLRQKTESC